MTTKDAALPTIEDSIAPYMDVIAAAMKELTAIRKANKLTDAEIRRLQTATEKKLKRIEENLRHVEAVR